MPQTAPRTALITGAARRIGRAIALDLAAHGWRVGVHYRNSRDEAEALAAEINASGGTAAALAANLADFREVQTLIARCADVLGQPTCLVNNASEFFLDTIGSVTCEGWDTHLDINLKAPIFLAQELYVSLPKGADGNVVNIIDQRVWRPTPDFFSYTISKSGLWTATQTLAQAMAPRVRVNAIGPGPVLQSIHQTETDFANERQSTLLGHGPSLPEIAAAVRFILDSPSMTGQMITLDGGQHLS
ncbi:SDR family oxidoreductase [Hyphomicrobium sulfonivorans]|uniref:SDR family oxidoreductase n=1 Tax=Hyphomicrobium sulfonivorans TaxID=121290 RepID=UPI000837B9A3|nr:SDR family oxidoreductase [Hyphomicrobium sulfonivorans]MBI1649721.1 SDR family oxidoreductase [Hyphomicrobium sulfonivorans]NSL71636.1 short chain dehydrogenase [Hyphomicrobium sulfonivorans]